MGCCFKHWIKFADILFGFIIVMPLGVFYWRGTWDIFEYYVNLDCRDIPANATSVGVRAHLHPRSRISPHIDTECDDQGGDWVAGLAGCLGMILLNCISPLLVKYCTPERCTWPGFIIISRLYFYIFAFAYMGHWRGVWELTDHYNGANGWRENLLGFGAVLGLSILFRCSKMALSTPWQCSFDIPDEEDLKEHGHSAVFKNRPWFRSTVETHGLWFFCIDQAFSQLIPLTLSILIWRCYWNILDDTYMVGDMATTSGVSVATGVGVMLFAMAISEPVFAKVSSKLDKHPLIFKILWEDFCYLIINSGVVLIWRGMWYLVADYILPDPVVGGWTFHVIGFAGLNLLCSGKNTFGTGVDLDGEEENGDGVRPSFSFFAYIFRKRIATVEAAMEEKVKGVVLNKTGDVQNGSWINEDGGLHNNGFSQASVLAQVNI